MSGESSGSLRSRTPNRRRDDCEPRSLDELRALEARLESAREEERSRIAREIHDELGQALTAIKMDLAWMSKQLRRGQGSVKERAQTALLHIDATIQVVRRIASELYPRLLDDMGFAEATRWLAKDFQARTGIRCMFGSGSASVRLEKHAAAALFRIVQESLNIVALHADATRVEIRFGKSGNSWSLEVTDNSSGLREREKCNSNSLGFAGMRERALALGGKMTVRSRRGGGTSVCVNLPYRGRKPRSSGGRATERSSLRR